jgi:hypothetical protein
VRQVIPASHMMLMPARRLSCITPQIGHAAHGHTTLMVAAEGKKLCLQGVAKIIFNFISQLKVKLHYTQDGTKVK